MDSYDLSLAKKLKDYYKSKIEEYDFLIKNDVFYSPAEKEVKLRNYKIYKEEYQRLYFKIYKEINGFSQFEDIGFDKPMKNKIIKTKPVNEFIFQDKDYKVVKVKKSKKSKSRSKSPKKSKSRSKSPKKSKSRSKSPKASKKITIPITKVKKCIPKRSKSRSKSPKFVSKIPKRC